MAARTGGATMAHPHKDLQSVPTLRAVHNRHPGMRIECQFALHDQRQRVRRENDSSDRFLSLLTARTGNPPIARQGMRTCTRGRPSRSGSAAVGPRQSQRTPQCQDQRGRPFHRNIAANAQNHIGPDLDRHNPGVTCCGFGRGSPTRMIHRLGQNGQRHKGRLHRLSLRQTVPPIRLTPADRLANCIALACITAWRIFWMTMLRRAEPNCAPAAIFADTELVVLERTTPALKPGQNCDLDFYLTAVARLGGYLARRHDPPPGTIVLWR